MKHVHYQITSCNTFQTHYIEHEQPHMSHNLLPTQKNLEVFIPKDFRNNGKINDNIVK
jgi:hypothetical protein